MKIAVFWPNWVGDAVMATPAVRALTRQFPQAQIISVLRPYIAGVLEGSPWSRTMLYLDKQGPWSRRWPHVALQLRRLDVDLAVLFPNSLRSAFTAWFGRCKRRVGFARYGRGSLLTDCLHPWRDLRGRPKPAPILDDYNRLAQAAGCREISRKMELYTTPEDEQRADCVWTRHGLNNYGSVICLNPGAAFGSAKHWPSEHFAELACELHEERECGVLVLCGPTEREMARHIVRLTHSAAVVSLADEPISLGLTKACIRRCDLLITTDSGPRHFAAAFDRPVITLFGPTHIEWTETYYPNAVHLQKRVDCGPCQQRVCPLDHRCMKLLTPAEVLSVVRGRFGPIGKHTVIRRKKAAS